MEKRKNKRVKLSFAVWYHTLNNNEISHGMTDGINISKNGMLLEVPDFIEKDTRVLVKFRIPNYYNKILIKGKVVHTEKKEKDLYNTGIQFQSVMEQDKKAINHFFSTIN